MYSPFPGFLRNGLWRQHPQNGSKKFTVAHFDQMANALGFESMAHMRLRRT